jgi:Na+-translocating ferredoxin:NAD+ oxidoreductase RNF subunit RnfB
MVEAVLFLFALGAGCGAILGFASKIFYVYEDPRISKVEGLVAGANCGGCGFAGCSAAANAIVNQEAPPNACILIGPENVTEIAGVMGVEVSLAEPLKSYNNWMAETGPLDRFYYRLEFCRAYSHVSGKRDCRVEWQDLGIA